PRGGARSSSLRQRFGPHQALPDHRVMCQASPYCFRSSFCHPKYPKLAHPEFLFDPGERKLRHLTPLPIDLLRFFGRHLGPEPRHYFVLRLQPRHRAPFPRRSRTTLRLERTTLTSGPVGAILPVVVAPLAALPD